MSQTLQELLKEGITHLPTETQYEAIFEFSQSEMKKVLRGAEQIGFENGYNIGRSVGNTEGFDIGYQAGTAYVDDLKHQAFNQGHSKGLFEGAQLGAYGALILGIVVAGRISLMYARSKKAKQGWPPVQPLAERR